MRDQECVFKSFFLKRCKLEPNTKKNITWHHKVLMPWHLSLSLFFSLRPASLGFWNFESTSIWQQLQPHPGNGEHDIEAAISHPNMEKTVIVQTEVIEASSIMKIFSPYIAWAGFEVNNYLFIYINYSFDSYDARQYNS